MAGISLSAGLPASRTATANSDLMSALRQSPTRRSALHLCPNIPAGGRFRLSQVQRPVARAARSPKPQIPHQGHAPPLSPPANPHRIPFMLEQISPPEAAPTAQGRTPGQGAP